MSSLRHELTKSFKWFRVIALLIAATGLAILLWKLAVGPRRLLELGVASCVTASSMVIWFLLGFATRVLNRR